MEVNSFSILEPSSVTILSLAPKAKLQPVITLQKMQIISSMVSKVDDGATIITNQNIEKLENTKIRKSISIASPSGFQRRKRNPLNQTNTTTSLINPPIANNLIAGKTIDDIKNKQTMILPSDKEQFYVQ